MKCEVKEIVKEEVKFSFDKEEIETVRKFIRLTDTYDTGEWYRLENTLADASGFPIDLDAAYEAFRQMLIFMDEHQE